MSRLKLTVWQVLEHRIIESTWCWQNIDSKLNSEIDVLTWDHRVPTRLRAIRFGFIPFDDTTPLLANVPHFLEHWNLKKPTLHGSLRYSYLWNLASWHQTRTSNPWLWNCIPAALGFCDPMLPQTFSLPSHWESAVFLRWFWRTFKNGVMVPQFPSWIFDSAR
jgi:hypothetical protein